MGYAVKAQNYQTCICGKVCKGRAALSNHGKHCAVERVRSAFTVWGACNGQPAVSDAALLRNLLPVARRLVEIGELDAVWLAALEPQP